MKRRKEKDEGQDALFEIEQVAVDDPGDEAAPGQGPAAEDIRKAASDEPEEAILDPLTREQREARRSARRQRRKVASYWLGAVAALSAVLLVILLSPWGPFKDTIYGKGAGPPRRTFQRQGGPPGARQTAPPGSSAPSLASATVPKGVAANRAGAPAPNAKKSDPTLPAIAIVVDDVGNGKEHLSEWLAIDAPLNFAVMPHLQLSSELAETLYGHGYAVMMHVPTTNAGNSYSGPGQLAVGMDRGTVFGTLDADLATIPHVEGMNNHQGGMGCDNWNIMYFECEWAKTRGLFVVDSNSSYNSQVTPACLALGMGKRKNQVFIDHENDPNYIRRAMQELAGLARKNGTSIGICHWHRPNTAKVVGEMINTLRSQGIHFAYVREITD
ncbi:MAG: divergent polysaccharide deacetylase family protein [Actinomycetota bacterium]